MNRDTVTRMIHETPEVGFQITKLIGLRPFRSGVEELLCKSAHARVAHALLELAERHGVSVACPCSDPITDVAHPAQSAGVNHATLDRVSKRPVDPGASRYGRL